MNTSRRAEDTSPLGRIFGVVMPSAVGAIDPDELIERMDVNALLERIDIEARANAMPA